MSRSARDYLLHILNETQYILVAPQGTDKTLFLQDETLKRAFIRSLEIVGEATKNLASAFRLQYLDITWQQISGMHDKLIHDYFGVDYEVVWDVVSYEIPILAQSVREIIARLDN